MRVLMTVALVLSIGVSSAWAADDKALADLNATLVEHDVLPRMDRFAEATAVLVPAADAYCAAPSAAGLDALKRAYNGAADAWQGIQHFRFGPMELLLRAQRIAFWPDPRNTIGRQLAEVIAAKDPTALTPQAFAQGRITIQGLPAMERLLYDDSAKLEGGTEVAYRCEMLRAIARNLASIGTDLKREWRDGPNTYARVVTTYGPEAHYRTASEATLDLFKSLYSSVEIVADHKLGKPLGSSLADAKPDLGIGAFEPLSAQRATGPGSRRRALSLGYRSVSARDGKESRVSDTDRSGLRQGHRRCEGGSHVTRGRRSRSVRSRRGRKDSA